MCDYGAPFCLAGVDTPLLLSPRGPLCSFYSYASRTITVGPKAGREGPLLWRGPMEYLVLFGRMQTITG